MSYLEGFAIAFVALTWMALAFYQRQTTPMSVRRLTRLGFYLALAIVIGILESFLPDLFLPGMKLGLANAVILLILLQSSAIEAFAVSMLRVLLVSLLRGTFLSMGGWMSFAGALLSFMGMVLAYYLSKKKLSPFFLSILGALLHNVGQILVAIFYLGTSSIAYYLPFLALLSLGTGFLIGFLANELKKRKIFDIAS